MKSLQARQEGHAGQIAILDLINDLLKLNKLDAILQATAHQAPKLINSHGCSIYLIPDLVNEYDGRLDEGEGERVSADEIKEEFIVLAASSQFGNDPDRIGKYFYRAGEGLTGWVFQAKQPLILDDMTNRKELEKYPGLLWTNKYKRAEAYFNLGDPSPKPFLAVPLMIGNKCYGVIRVATSEDRKPFPEWAKKMFISFAGVISQRIEIGLTINQQREAIENLIRIGSISTSNQQEAFNDILKEAQKAVGASTCCLYTLDKYGETVEFRAATDSAHPHYTYGRDDGLIGWIFKTGKPLRIDDTGQFLVNKYLEDSELERYSDSPLINDDDREIRALENEVLQPQNQFPHFMGVPLLTSGGKTRGVLIALSKLSEDSFTHDDLILLMKIAANISMLLDNLEREKLNEMLIGIGQEHADHRLFRYVAERLPEMVFARGCSIFLRSDKDNSFHLKYTNSPELKIPKTNRLRRVRYAPGVGKTGMVAKLGRSLVINHYGTGSLDQRRLWESYDRYCNNEKYRGINLVGILKDRSGTGVGLARLVRTDPDEADFADEERKIFDQFITKNAYIGRGLSASTEDKLCEEGSGGFAKSFLACPLRDRQGNIFGVLRIPRTFPGGAFTDEALALVVSVCNRLSAVIESKQSKQNLITLSKINTQINSSSGSKDRDSIFRSILRAATNTLGFEFATIQLVDPVENTIYTKMGMKNRNIQDATDPNKWLADGRHPLDPPDGEPRDIQAWLLREHQKEFVVKGWDPHFDWDMYNEHGHDKLIRAFIPIVIKKPHKVIGTIEAGHNIKRKSSIDRNELMMLKALADQAAIAINNNSLQEELTKAELLQLVPSMSHVLRSPAAMLIMQFKEIMGETLRKKPDLKSLAELVRWANRSALTIYSMSSTLAVEVESRDDLWQMPDIRQVDLIALIKEELLKWFMLPRNRVNAQEVLIKVNNALTQKHLPLSELEKTWLKVILINLLHNARKYSPEGSFIQINCRQDTAEGGIVISVIDQGPGVPPEVLPKLFKQHIVAKTKAKGWPDGSGLGLYTVNKLASKLDWTCKVENISPRGAKFDICIPKGWRGRT
ncbi:MAG TPA: GAF domain-containing protein [Blastocatellia bacterium]|nr:GAF domain-containing protein [Blastocatellia bacterium]